MKCDTTCDIEINNVRDNGLIGPYPNDMNFMIAHVFTGSHGSTTPRKRSKRGVKNGPNLMISGDRDGQILRSRDRDHQDLDGQILRSSDRVTKITTCGHDLTGPDGS